MPDAPRRPTPQDDATVPPTVPSSPSAPVAIEVPSELAGSSKYEILGKLGQGGMGAVFKARHTFLNDLVAIKVMNADFVGQASARSRFLREMQAVGQLKHPNIVRALDAEQIGSLLVLVMEYVSGITLDRLVAQRGALPVDFSCHCIVQAALGLQHAHEKGMIHRDIKPANLIVTAKEKEVKVLDFGLARGPRERTANDHQTQMGAIMGTPAFMAPEQASDASSADIRADVYSLGCTLYFLLSGQSPFQRDTALSTMMAQVGEEARPLPQVRGDVPRELWSIIAKMLAKKPAMRHQTPIEVAKALLPFRGKSARGNSIPTSPPPVPPQRDISAPTAIAEPSRLGSVIQRPQPEESPFTVPETTGP